MAESTRNVSGETNRIKDQTFGTTGEAVAAIREKAGDVVQTVREAGKDIGHMARQRLSHFRDTASDYVQQRKENLQAMRRSVQSEIQQHTLTSVLLATGVGFLLGVLWMKRK